MKKSLALLLTAVLLFSLSACKNVASDTDKNSSPAPQNSTQQYVDEQQTSQNNQTAQNQTGTTNPDTLDPQITRERAIKIALEKATLKESDIHDLETELDYEKGVLVWEVDFDYKNFDYSYDIDANTGVIVFEEVEKDDY